MTNQYPTPIQAQNLERGDRIAPMHDTTDIKVVSRNRLINHEKCRIDFTDGTVKIAPLDEIFAFLE